jgi:hypothetical protein
MEHTKKFVPSTKCENFNNKKSLQTYLIWFNNLQTFSISHFCKLRLVNLIYFYSIQWILFFCRYECGYGLEDHCKDPNHMRSIKHSCLAHFSIKRFLHNPNVVEIDFYHQIHTQTNETWCMWLGGFTVWMLAYVPHVFHKSKDFIWTQLRLGYTMKQIYDKHKEIWWARANLSEHVT